MACAIRDLRRDGRQFQQAVPFDPVSVPSPPSFPRSGTHRLINLPSLWPTHRTSSSPASPPPLAPDPPPASSSPLFRRPTSPASTFWPSVGFPSRAGSTVSTLPLYSTEAGEHEASVGFPSFPLARVPSVWASRADVLARLCLPSLPAAEPSNGTCLAPLPFSLASSPFADALHLPLSTSVPLSTLTENDMRDWSTSVRASSPGVAHPSHSAPAQAQAPAYDDFSTLPPSDLPLAHQSTTAPGAIADVVRPAPSALSSADSASSSNSNARRQPPTYHPAAHRARPGQYRARPPVVRSRFYPRPSTSDADAAGPSAGTALPPPGESTRPAGDRSFPSENWTGSGQTGWAT